MSTPSTVKSSTAGQPASFIDRIKPHLTVYHLTVASVLGLATVGFTVLIAVLIIIAQNFNVLGWTE